MSFTCTICDRDGYYCSFYRKVDLINHTENKHGRHGVYEGVRSWERSRNQENVLTTNQYVRPYQYEIDDSFYDEDSDTWDCKMCDRAFSSFKGLSDHLNSGKHESSRYFCQDCPKSFSSLTALTMHLNATGHARTEDRLIHTLIKDAQAPMLMITNGSVPRLHYEATLWFDGGARPNPGEAGAGWVLIDDRGYTLAETGCHVYPLQGYWNVTNNQAEYVALIQGLREAIRQRIKRLLVHGDSELVIRQMTGEYNCTSNRIIGYYNDAMNLLCNFQIVDFVHVDRSKNRLADEIATSFI